MFFGWPINIVWVYVLYLYECKNFFGCFRLGEKTRWIVPGCATANRSSLDSFLETRDNLRRLKLESTDFAVRGRCDSGGTDLSKSHEHTGNVFYFRNTIDYTLNYKQRDFKYIIRSLDLVFFLFYTLISLCATFSIVGGSFVSGSSAIVAVVVAAGTFDCAGHTSMTL